MKCVRCGAVLKREKSFKSIESKIQFARSSGWAYKNEGFVCKDCKTSVERGRYNGMTKSVFCRFINKNNSIIPELLNSYKGNLINYGDWVKKNHPNIFNKHYELWLKKAGI